MRRDCKRAWAFPCQPRRSGTLSDALAEHIEPIFEELVRQAAQGDVLYNDDTTVKILEMMGEAAPASGLGRRWRCACKTSPEDVGEGAPKSGADGHVHLGHRVDARRAANRVVLQRAAARRGESQGRVGRRAAELPPPIQMCDALSRNMPAELRTIVANCLAHGRRQFVEVADRFPEECRHVLESLAVVYRNDALARERKPVAAGSDLLFHQAESGPTMEELHVWLVRAVRRAAGGAELGAWAGPFRTC